MTNNDTATILQFRNAQVFAQYTNQTIESSKEIISQLRASGVRDTLTIEVNGVIVEVDKIK